MQGPRGPRNFLIRASKVNIGMFKLMFHLILHDTEPLSCINWFLTHDTPSSAKPSLRARKWLGSMRTPVSISSYCFERKGDINLQYHTFQGASQGWDWPDAKLAKMRRNVLQLWHLHSCSWIVKHPYPPCREAFSHLIYTDLRDDKIRIRIG